MKKVAIVLSLIIGCIFEIQAQGHNVNDEISYEIINNSPEDLPSLRFNINILDININRFNSFIGYQIEGEYKFANKYIFGGFYNSNYHFGFMESIVPNINFRNNSMGVYSKIVLYSWVKIKKTRMSVDMLSNPMIYTKVPTKHLMQLALRLKFQNSYAHYDEYDNYSLFGKKKNWDNVQIWDNVSHSFIADPNSPVQLNFISPGIESNIISFGLSKIILVNTESNIKGYGYRHTKYEKEFYADFLYSIGMTFDNIQLEHYIKKDSLGRILSMDNPSGTATLVDYELNENTNVINYGFKVGYKNTNLNKVGFGYGIEAGALPGPGKMTTNLFLRLRIVFTICPSSKFDIHSFFVKS